MEPLLTIAEDLERRDERAAAALLEVERLQAEVDELRTRAGEVAAFLRELPAARAAVEADEQAAAEAQEGAIAVWRGAEDALAHLRERGSENARLQAARAAQHARDALEEAELRVARHGPDLPSDPLPWAHKQGKNELRRTEMGFSDKSP